MFENLTDDQKQSFAIRNQRLGLGPEETTFSQEHIDATGDEPFVLSSDPFASHVPPKHIAVGDIAELNKLIGVADTEDDSHVEYPEPPSDEHLNLLTNAKSRTEFKQSLDQDVHAHIKKAAETYIIGNSAKLKAYEPLINATMFPTTLAVFSADSTVINKPFVIEGPHPAAVNLGTCTVDRPNGVIMVYSHVTVKAQNFTVQES